MFATFPCENAAELVTILNDEPGGNVAWIARFSSGWAGSLRSCLSTLSSLVPSRVVSTFGSNVGYDASARIAPVLGLIATTRSRVAAVSSQRLVGSLLGRRADSQLDRGALLLLAGQQGGQVVHGKPRVGAVRAGCSRSARCRTGCRSCRSR